MPVIQPLGRLRHEYCLKFEPSLGYSELTDSLTYIVGHCFKKLPLFIKHSTHKVHHYHVTSCISSKWTTAAKLGRNTASPLAVPCSLFLLQRHHSSSFFFFPTLISNSLEEFHPPLLYFYLSKTR